MMSDEANFVSPGLLAQEMTQTHRDRTTEGLEGGIQNDVPHSLGHRVPSGGGCWRKERTLESEGCSRIFTVIKGASKE